MAGPGRAYGRVAPCRAPLRDGAQTASQIDLFFVDGNGVVNVMWVVDGGVWQGPVGLTQPGAGSPGGQIATARQTDTRSTSSSSARTVS